MAYTSDIQTECCPPDSWAPGGVDACLVLGDAPACQHVAEQVEQQREHDEGE